MKTQPPKRIELTQEELSALLKRIEASVGKEDFEIIKGMAETIVYLSRMVEEKGVSVKRLLKMMFGSTTEKTRNIIEKAVDVALEGKEGELDEQKPEESKQKRKGHGRNGVNEYVSAEKIKIPHESLNTGDACPEEGCKGKAYGMSDLKHIVRISGQAPLHAKVYEGERLRCNLCGKIFTATMPEGLGEKKYDETSTAMIALLKYGSGFPFNRLDKFQKNLGIPLPRSTQWDIVSKEALKIGNVYNELIQQAAQGEILHNDDTTAKILEFMGKRKEKRKVKRRGKDPPKKGAKERKGIFTSGIVSVDGGKKIALFFTERKHAGENLRRVLAEREAELEPPIQMCDALSRNVPADSGTIVSNCNAHGRRQFVELAEQFPEECRHVLEVIGEVYRVDDEARTRSLSPDERLAFHREHSRGAMIELRLWFRKQFRERSVEPNSSLGRAFSYMMRHWHKLTLFYRCPGAPLDNNVVERALKKSILHRKNSLFFLTLNGARVGDLFMSLIHTAELAGENPFNYLTELIRHSDKISENPQAWMPWSYRETLTALTP